MSVCVVRCLVCGPGSVFVFGSDLICKFTSQLTLLVDETYNSATR